MLRKKTLFFLGLLLLCSFGLVSLEKEQSIQQEDLAIFGGEGKLPLRAYEYAVKQGKHPYLIVVKGITSSDLIQKVPEEQRIYASVFRLGSLVAKLKKAKVKKLLMIGRIPHKSLLRFQWWKVDFATLKLLFSLKDWRADTVLGGLVGFYEKHGIEVESTHLYLRECLAIDGLLNEIDPSKRVWKDIYLGFSLAKELGKADIGQTVVVKKGIVVALEALEGTDRCIERAGELAGEGCVVVKVAKPDQSHKFDVPTVGLTTINKLKKIKASALAIEAGQTFIADSEVLNAAKQASIAIVALTDSSALGL